MRPRIPQQSCWWLYEWCFCSWECFMWEVVRSTSQEEKYSNYKGLWDSQFDIPLLSLFSWRVEVGLQFFKDEDIHSHFPWIYNQFSLMAYLLKKDFYSTLNIDLKKAEVLKRPDVPENERVGWWFLKRYRFCQHKWSTFWAFAKLTHKFRDSNSEQGSEWIVGKFGFLNFSLSVSRNEGGCYHWSI